MKMWMLLKTHATTEAECGKNCSFFFATCDVLHLTCFDELSRKKKSPRFAPVENMLCVLRSIVSLPSTGVTLEPMVNFGHFSYLVVLM